MRQYTTEDVVQIRNKRRKLTPSKPTLSRIDFQKSLGDLKAAGHLNILGVTESDFQVRELESYESPDGNEVKVKRYQMSFDSYTEHHGEKPHLRGYLRSGSSKDKLYKVKGWINETGEIRLEIVQ